MIELDGQHLSLAQIYAIVSDKEKIEISEKARTRIRKARKLLETQRNMQRIYGLNTGVGWNKDREVPEEMYAKYNRNLLLSHNVGTGEECSPEEVRVAMLVRLNGFLNGRSGVSEEIVNLLCEFLNRGVYPIMHKIGSVGEADIGILASIGLCMIGDGDAYIDGKRVTGRKILEYVGQDSIRLGVKDGLSIVSSNAMSVGMAILTISKLQRIWNISLQIYGLFLEGYGAVLDPIGKSVNEIRGIRGQQLAAAYCRECLKDSYLYEKKARKALQDPLSIRDECAVSGAFWEALEYVKEQVLHEVNTSGDNPCVIEEENKIVGSAGFEPLTWVLGFEMLLQGLGHMSSMVVYRIIKIDNPNFSGVGRFLSPDEGNVIAFSTIQKTCSDLEARIKICSRSSSLDYIALAGDIEDHATNAMLIIQKLNEAAEYYSNLLAIELMHAAQAVDLQNVADCLGEQTGALYREYRKQVSFLSEDRDLAKDIAASNQFIKNLEAKIEI